VVKGAVHFACKFVWIVKKSGSTDIFVLKKEQHTMKPYSAGGCMFALIIASIFSCAQVLYAQNDLGCGWIEGICPPGRTTGRNR